MLLVDARIQTREDPIPPVVLLFSKNGKAKVGWRAAVKLFSNVDGISPPPFDAGEILFQPRE